MYILLICTFLWLAESAAQCNICRVGQNRIYTLYMTVCMVNSLPKILYTHRIYIWFWPTLNIWCAQQHVRDLSQNAYMYTQGWPEPYRYGVYTVFLAGESPNIRSYTVLANPMNTCPFMNCVDKTKCAKQHAMDLSQNYTYIMVWNYKILYHMYTPCMTVYLVIPMPKIP